MKLLTTILILLFCITSYSQDKVLYMKSFQIKSSNWNNKTETFDDITDWEPSKLMFTITGKTMSIDNKKKSKFTLTIIDSEKTSDGTKLTYNAYDEDYKKCDVIFYFPKLKTGEKQWSLIYIVYNDLLWEHKVSRYYPGQLDNFLDN